MKDLGAESTFKGPKPQRVHWYEDFHDRFAVMRENLSRIMADLKPPTQSSAFWRMRALGTMLDACSQMMAAFEREGAAPVVRDVPPLGEPATNAAECDCEKAKRYDWITQATDDHCRACGRGGLPVVEAEAAAKEGA